MQPNTQIQHQQQQQQYQATIQTQSSMVAQQNHQQQTHTAACQQSNQLTQQVQRDNSVVYEAPQNASHQNAASKSQFDQLFGSSKQQTMISAQQTTTNRYPANNNSTKSRSIETKRLPPAKASTEHKKMAATKFSSVKSRESKFPAKRKKISQKAPPKSNSAKKILKIALHRLKPEQIKQMTRSVSTFVKNSPDTAKKLGVMMDECDMVKAKERIPKIELFRLKPKEIDQMTRSVSTFVKNSPDTAQKLGVMMDECDMVKAKQRNLERKSNENECPFSQPKLKPVSHNDMLPKNPHEDVQKSQTRRQFVRNMRDELGRLEETDHIDNIDDIDYYNDCISSKSLEQLSNDVAKLKAKGGIDGINENELTLLINFAMRNVDVVKNLSAGPDIKDDGEEQITKILDATEACLLVCNLYSMAKSVKFLQEDDMNKIVKFTQLQIRETIFPSYDSAFSLESKKKPDGRKKKSNNDAYNNVFNVSRKVQLLYTKLVQLTRTFVVLFDKYTFIDTIVLAVSPLAVEPFFADNIDALQFSCLELITTIFRKEIYADHRNTIFSDILTPMIYLPQSKRNMRPYRVAHNGDSIQMITALVLQLIQSSCVLPESLCVTANFDKDDIMKEKFEECVNIRGSFLETFLNEIKSRSSDPNFRPLLENFITDLLTTVNRPEWPASEWLLSFLCKLLEKYMRDESMDLSMRVASLEYLGTVAARLRKDTVESHCQVHVMDQLIECIKSEHDQEKENDEHNRKTVIDPEEARTESLQRILIHFLAVNAHVDNLVYDSARHFYLTQWYNDAQNQKQVVAARKKQSKKRKYRDFDSSQEEGIESNAQDQQLTLEKLRLLENRKTYLLSKIAPFSPNRNVQDIRTYIDHKNANLIAQYLASKRPFSQCFNSYLRTIISAMRYNPSIRIRTKAIKCLALIAEVDPSILTQEYMQIGISQKFLDESVSVREAAIDLIGKNMLNDPKLMTQYYDELSKRILDMGVSVRKCVIKILSDVCIENPNHSKIPEICVNMIGRMNDEEGIQKVVTDVFMRMWFTPCDDIDQESIQRKINQMIDVVSEAKDTDLRWLDCLLRSVLTPKEKRDIDRTAKAPKKEPPTKVIKACQQLVDGLVKKIPQLEPSDSVRALSCVTTLHLLAKVRPTLLVKHGITLEGYLTVECDSQRKSKFISCIAEILEEIVPLMEHPSETFLAETETHLMVLACSQNKDVVHSCLSCLGAIVNKITKNYRLIRDCFVRCYKPLIDTRKILKSNPNVPIDQIYQPRFRRGIFMIGLILRFFDFKQPLVFGKGCGPKETGLPQTICNDTFEHLFYFASLTTHNDIRLEALIAIGHFCVKNFDYLIDTNLRNLFCNILTSPNDVIVKSIVLRNITWYLDDADVSMSVEDKEDRQKQPMVEKLCDMGDAMSGMASRIIQLYLKKILNSLVNKDDNVRWAAMKAIQLVLRQGLVIPIDIVPYLICLSTDPKNAHRANHHLQEIEEHYPGFVNRQSQLGISLSLKLQTVLQNNPGETTAVFRGYKDEPPTALNSFLYTLLRNTKPQRRALVQAIIKQFDEPRTTLRQMLYLADNLAYFPYTVQDEPLYIIHQIMGVIIAGTSLLETFEKNLKPRAKPGHEQNDPNTYDDDDEDKEALFNRLPEDTSALQECITSSQGCILLLRLKQHLKDLYKIDERQISEYTPSENNKVYEKALSRVSNVPKFNPQSTIEVINEGQTNAVLSEKEKNVLLDRYLNFKQLMEIDDEESDDESDDDCDDEADDEFDE